jgi:glycosyltransferase involved in cell wall biosynthesis
MAKVGVPEVMSDNPMVDTNVSRDIVWLGDSERQSEPVSFWRKLRRLLWHIVARLLMLLSVVSLVIARWFGRRRRLLPDNGCDIMLTGRFDSDNWILAHLGPLSASKRCSRVWMVSTNPVPEIPKVSAIYPPKWLIKVLGATRARLFTFIYAAIRKKPDIVGGFHIMANGITAIIIGRLIGARSMYFCVGGPVEIINGGVHSTDSYFKKMETADAVVEKRLIRIVKAADMIITMGSKAVDFFREKGVKSLLKVVSGGLDSSRFRPTDETALYDIILTGRLVEVKRIDVFLNAVRHVANKIPNLKVVIVGDGELRNKLQKLSVSLGIENNVSFAGYQDDIESWLRKSKIFVLTSDSEGLSLSMMEAMMCGLPVVVSDVGDMGDLVENGVNGYLIPRRCPELFAERLVQLLSEPEVLEKISLAARQSALKYEIQTTVTKWDNIIDDFRKSSNPVLM